MKMTSREMNLIFALLTVFIVYLLYTFAFNPLISNLLSAKDNLEALKLQQSQVEENKAAIPGILKQQEELIAETEEKTEIFLPDLNEDLIITFFAGTVGKGGPAINGINFGQLTSVDLAAMILPETVSITYPMGDLANTIRPEKEVIAGALPQPTGIVLTRGVSVDFNTASYEQALSQLRTVEETKRTITVDFLSLTKGETGTLSGSVHYNFYGLDKLSDEDGGLPKTPLADAKGKANPFN
jgi:hypothetical protein